VVIALRSGRNAKLLLRMCSTGHAGRSINKGQIQFSTADGVVAKGLKLRQQSTYKRI
jgi:hypothetical protein